MVISTKYFGEIEIEDEKKIHFKNGIAGFENYKDYVLMYDKDDESQTITWLQSLEVSELCIPLISPFIVIEKYNPYIEDELLESIAPYEEDNIVVFVTLTVPKEVTNMTCNLKAPIIINLDNHKACQVIVENSEYLIKYKVYDIIKSKKGE